MLQAVVSKCQWPGYAKCRSLDKTSTIFSSTYPYPELRSGGVKPKICAFNSGYETMHSDD